MDGDVVFSRSALKKSARERMSEGGYSIYFIFPLYGLLSLLYGSFRMTVLYFLSEQAAVFFDLLFALVSFFLFTPMAVSIIRYFILFSRGETPSILVAFDFFKKEFYWRFLGVIFWESIWFTLWSICIAIVYVLIFSFTTWLESELLVLVIPLMVIFGVSFSIYLILAYFTAIYLIADKNSVKVTKSLSMSRLIMKGHKWELFVLIFSFFPWFLLSIVTLGLALIYVLPYMQVTLAKYYDYVMQKTLKEQGIN